MSAIGTYSYTLSDVPGVVAANTFTTITNPTSSNRVFAFASFIGSTYATTTSQTAASLGIYRVSNVSGGSDVSDDIAQLNSAGESSLAVIRIDNPTVTVGSKLLVTPPPISSGTGVTTVSTESINPLSLANTLLVYPGESVGIRTEAGNVNQLWNIHFAWVEFF